MKKFVPSQGVKARKPINAVVSAETYAKLNEIAAKAKIKRTALVAQCVEFALANMT